jgi:DNA repair exonuclease SbcCD ATPase subunit
MIESGARENATKIIQAAESEIKERRIELNRETDRLDKRRCRTGQPLRQNGTTRTKLNKRQSQVDRRGNEIDKLYEDQIKKLEQIAQLTPGRCAQGTLCRR